MKGLREGLMDSRLVALSLLIDCLLDTVGDVVAQWLVRRTWDLKVESSSPGRCTHVVFLGKTLNSHNASLHPGV